MCFVVRYVLKCYTVHVATVVISGSSMGVSYTLMCGTSHSRLWLCTFTLTVSLGAVLLLPMSILSNEILVRYPNSYYIKWLNGSLIHGMSDMLQYKCSLHTKTK